MKWGWIAAFTLMAAPASADEFTVRSSLTFKGALVALKPGFEAASGDKLTIVGAGDTADLAFLQKQNFAAAVKEGAIDGASVTDIARVNVGLAVKAGGPPLDISSDEKLKAVLRAAKSIGISLGPSGPYLMDVIAPKLGIADELKDKVKTTAGNVVGEAVVKGDVDIGVQQMSELLPIEGLTVRRIPEDLQTVTLVAAGRGMNVKSPAAVGRFIAYVKSPAAAPVFKAMDLAQVTQEPVK